MRNPEPTEYTQENSMAKNVSIADFITLQNLVGRYQWLVDEGDSDG